MGRTGRWNRRRAVAFSLIRSCHRPAADQRHDVRQLAEVIVRAEGSSFLSPFDEQITKYALRFAQPVFFGQSPAAAYSASLASGTGTLIRLGEKFIGVTCHHVLDGYRARRQLDPQTVFHFGRIEFDPERYLIAENRGIDLVTLDLTSFVGKVEEMTALNFVDPIRWPPSSITTDDVIAFAGFPGIWREQVSLAYLRFYSFSSGASPVSALGERHLMTRIEPEECVAAIRGGLVMGSLGGLSGGPVFVWRTGPILVAELIGFAIEYQETLDLLYIRRAVCLESDGGLHG
jgi:hypothetical protein